jgi:antitoxin (DNA-binding transcriptional repressor) of toxin-antitoxin stability system
MKLPTSAKRFGSSPLDESVGTCSSLETRRSNLKEIELSLAVRSLADYAADLGDEILLVTKRRRPVAVVVPLKNIDRESVALSYDPKFLAIIEKSRADIAAGRTMTLEAVERTVKAKPAPRARKRSPARRSR